MPCLLFLKSSCCIFLVKVNAKTCLYLMLIFSHKIIIRCFCFFSSCCTSLLLLSIAIWRTSARHRNACSAQVSTYRYAVRTGIYVTFACRGFSFKVHPLSIHLSAYKRKCRPCKQKLKTACRWYYHRLPLVFRCLLFRFWVRFPRICCTSRTNYDINATYLEGTFVQTFAPAFAFPLCPSIL